jgi:hypothetical protein
MWLLQISERNLEKKNERRKMKNEKLKIKIYHLSLVGFFLSSFFFILYSRVSASDFSLGIYPPIIQIQATAPTALKKDITIVNASQDPEDVTILFKPFTNAPSNAGVVAYLPDSKVPQPDRDIFQKIQLLDADTPVTTLTLAPKQKKTLTIRIGLPQDEPAGDYYFSIIFLSKNDSVGNQNGSTINAGIATNVLLSIGPQDATTGFLHAFSTPWFAQSGPIPFTVQVANTSRHYITPTGHILIRNMFGQLVGKVDLLSVNVLAESSRYIPGSPGNRYQAIGISMDHPIALWNEKVLFGPYRANIVVSLSNQGPLFTRTIYFFVMPWEYFVGIGIALVILLVVFERIRERAKKI